MDSSVCLAQGTRPLTHRTRPPRGRRSKAFFHAPGIHLFGRDARGERASYKHTNWRWGKGQRKAWL